MVVIKQNRKLFLILLYVLSIIFFPLVIIPIFLHISWKKKDKNFKEKLLKIGFNNYKEIETGNSKYLIFNDDGRFLEVKGYDYNIYDVRNYNVEFSIPDGSNSAIHALVAYHVAGPAGALGVSNAGNNFLIFKKKGILEEPIKFRIYGKKAKETLLTFLVHYEEKGYI